MSYKLTAGVLGRRRREKKVATEFIILVDTTLAGSASDTMQLPIRGTDMTIDWGDGFVETGVTQTALPSSANWRTRVYPDGGGVKEIKISGLDRIYFAGTGDRLKLLEIQNWGTTQWTTMSVAFRGCSNMIGTFTDVPDLSNVLSMESMFRQCANFNPISLPWNTQNVQNMEAMFFQATAFNSDISLWNTINVINSRVMFLAATAFNSDISQWNTQNNKLMDSMFQQATNFNSDISGWNTGNVTNMANMFLLAPAFNSDISLWNTENVTRMNSMFQGANSFNQDLSGWNTAKVTNMGAMFRSATAFNQDLSGWCVSLIPSLPSLFDSVATAWVYNANGDTGSTDGVDPATIINRPIWGTCPA